MTSRARDGAAAAPHARVGGPKTDASRGAAEVVLNTRRADRGVWLLKVPIFVADALAYAAGEGPGGAAASSATASDSSQPTQQPGQPPPGAPVAGAGSTSGTGCVVGKVRMTFDPLQGDTPQFSVHLCGTSGVGAREVSAGARAEAAAVAASPFQLVQQRGHIPMHVFSELHPTSAAATAAAARGGSGAGAGKTPPVMLEGKVEHKFDVAARPENAGYLHFVKEREKNANQPRRSIMRDDGKPGGIGRLFPGTAMVVSSQVKRKPGAPFSAAAAKAASVDAKRVRASRDAVESRLFRLFEGQPVWTLRALTDATQQPQQFLKDILGDMCVYHKKGPLQGQYELKPELVVGAQAAPHTKDEDGQGGTG